MCLSHQLWSELSSEIHHFLAGIDLASIIAKREVRQIAARQDGVKEDRVDDHSDELDIEEIVKIPALAEG